MNTLILPQQWLAAFQKAVQNGYGHRELRIGIFRETHTLVQQGFYETLGQIIPFPILPIHANTQLYAVAPQYIPIKPTKVKTKIEVRDEDYVTSLLETQSKSLFPCLVNMGNRQLPGDGAILGADHPEAELLRRSNLFQSIFQFADFGLTHGVPRNIQASYPLERETGAVYSPYISIFRGTEQNGYPLLTHPCLTHVITVPPIKSPRLIETSNRVIQLHPDFIEPTKIKIRTIFRLAAIKGHNALILGAFGCGLHKNPPLHIAQLFKEVLQESDFKNYFHTIIFSISTETEICQHHNPEGNFRPFQAVFQDS